MKKIDHDYWEGYKDADYDNPDLRLRCSSCTAAKDSISGS